jgi:crotonobetainyl-CoA:carnitine CoA-transferase CaiB-like acyl-CoA transferase
VALVRAALRRHGREHWLRVLDDAGIPCAPLHTLGELADHPHTRDSGMAFDYDHPAFGALRGIAQPVRIDGERPALRRPPPLRGEHTRQVLQELGLEANEIEQLLASGAVREPDQ